MKTTTHDADEVLKILSDQDSMKWNELTINGNGVYESLQLPLFMSKFGINNNQFGFHWSTVSNYLYHEWDAQSFRQFIDTFYNSENKGYDFLISKCNNDIIMKFNQDMLKSPGDVDVFPLIEDGFMNTDNMWKINVKGSSSLTDKNFIKEQYGHFYDLMTNVKITIPNNCMGKAASQLSTYEGKKQLKQAIVNYHYLIRRLWNKFMLFKAMKQYDYQQTKNNPSNYTAQFTNLYKHIIQKEQDLVTEYNALVTAIFKDFDYIKVTELMLDKYGRIRAKQEANKKKIIFNSEQEKIIFNNCIQNIKNKNNNSLMSNSLQKSLDKIIIHNNMNNSNTSFHDIKDNKAKSHISSSQHNSLVNSQNANNNNIHNELKPSETNDHGNGLPNAFDNLKKSNLSNNLKNNQNLQSRRSSKINNSFDNQTLANPAGNQQNQSFLQKIKRGWNGFWGTISDTFKKITNSDCCDKCLCNVNDSDEVDLSQHSH